MKKMLLLAALIFATGAFALDAISFPDALKDCSPYSQTGGVTKDAQYFGIKITLEKSKGKCLYKERIFQGKGWEQLTCSFNMEQMGAIADSMKRYNEAYKSEIAKNKIFEAKMTSNGEIFNTYLANPTYCKLSHSTAKK